METLQINIRLDGDSLRYPFSSGEITSMTNQIASSSDILLKDVNVTKISTEECTIKQTNSNIDDQQPIRKRLSGAQRRKKKREKAKNAISNLQQSQNTSNITEMGLLSGVNKTLISVANASFSERPNSSTILTKDCTIKQANSNIYNQQLKQKSKYASNLTEMGLLSGVNKTLISVASASFSEGSSSSTILTKDCTMKQTNSNIDNQQLEQKKLSRSQKRKIRKAKNALSKLQQSQYTSNLTEMGLLSDVNKTLISTANASFSERPSSSNVRNEFSSNRSIQQSEYNSNLNEIRTLSDISKRPRSMENLSLSEECTSNNFRNEFCNNRRMHQFEYSSKPTEVSTLSGVGQMLPMKNTSLSDRRISSKKPASLSGPNSEPLPSFKMAIVKSDFPAFEILPEEVKLIQNEILKKIDEIPTGESLPLLNNFNLIEGSLIYSCENRFTCQWLRKALDGYVFRDGTVLRVFRENDLPQSIKMAFWTSDLLTTDTYKLLLRLKSYNPEFKIENWIILEKNIDFQGQQLTILVDIDSFKAISKANYKAYTGVDQGTFSVLQTNTD